MILRKSKNTPVATNGDEKTKMPRFRWGLRRHAGDVAGPAKNKTTKEAGKLVKEAEAKPPPIEEPVKEVPEEPQLPKLREPRKLPSVQPPETITLVRVGSRIEDGDTVSLLLPDATFEQQAKNTVTTNVPQSPDRKAAPQSPSVSSSRKQLDGETSPASDGSNVRRTIQRFEQGKSNGPSAEFSESAERIPQTPSNNEDSHTERVARLRQKRGEQEATLQNKFEGLREDTASNSTSVFSCITTAPGEKKKRRVVVRRRIRDDSHTGSNSMTASSFISSTGGLSNVEKKLRLSEKKVKQLKVILSKSDAIINKLSETKKQLLREKEAFKDGAQLEELTAQLKSKEQDNNKLRSDLERLQEQFDLAKKEEKVRTQQHQEQMATLQRDWFDMEQKVENQAVELQQHQERSGLEGQLEMQNLETLEKLKDKELENERLHEQLDELQNQLQRNLEDHSHAATSHSEQASEMQESLRGKDSENQRLQERIKDLQGRLEKSLKEQVLFASSQQERTLEIQKTVREKLDENQRLHKQIQALQSQKSSNDQSLALNERALADLREKLDRAEHNCILLSEQLDQSRKSENELEVLRRSNNENADDKAQIQMLQKELAELKREAEKENALNVKTAKELEERTVKAELEKTRMQGVLADLHEQMEFTDKRNVQMLRQLQGRESQSGSQASAQLQAEKAKLQASLLGSQEATKKAQEKIETLQKVVRMQEAEAEEAEHQAKEAVRNAERLKQLELDNATMQVQLENCQNQIQTLAAENTAIKTNLANSQESLEMAHNTIDILENQLVEMEGSDKADSERVEQLETDGNRLREDNENLQKHAKLNVTLRSNLANTQTELKQALETITLLEKEADEKEEARLVMARQIETGNSQLDSEIGKLQSLVQTKDMEKSSLQAELMFCQGNLKKSRDAIKSLEVRLMETEGIRRQEAEKLNLAQLSAQKFREDLENLQLQAQNSSAEKESLRSCLSISQESLKVAHDTIDVYEKKMTEADEKYLQMEVKVRRAELDSEKFLSEVDRLRDLAKATESENSSLRIKLAAHQEDLERAHTLISGLKNRLAETDDSRRDFEDQIRSLEASGERIRAELNTLHEQSNTTESDNDLLRSRVANYKRDLEQAKDTISILENESEELERTTAELRETKSKMTKLERECEALQIAMSELRRERTDTETAAKQCREQLDLAHQEIEFLERKTSRLHEAEEKVIRHRSRIASLEEEIVKMKSRMEEMGFDADDAEERLREANEEIRFLEQKAARLYEAEDFIHVQRESIASLEKELELTKGLAGMLEADLMNDERRPR